MVNPYSDKARPSSHLVHLPALGWSNRRETTVNDSGFRPTPIEVPTLAEITELYRFAVDAGDEGIKATAEQAVRRLAVAEAAAAEVATLVGFARSVRD